MQLWLELLDREDVNKSLAIIPILSVEGFKDGDLYCKIDLKQKDRIRNAIKKFKNIYIVDNDDITDEVSFELRDYNFKIYNKEWE